MRHCEYAKPNGHFCGSPALRGRDYCYWHLTHLARRLHAEKQEATADHTPLELPPLEDANSVQLAIMMVMDAMLHDRIGPKKSGQLLYALQLASSNLKQGVCFQPVQQANPVQQVNPDSDADEKPEPEPVVQCSSYESLEADYDIQEHAEQLHAAGEDDASRAAAQAQEQEDQMTEVQYLQRYFKFDPAHEPSEEELAEWRIQRQRDHEGFSRILKHIASDVGEAKEGNPQVAKQLKQLLDDAYRVAGLHPAPGDAKPAMPQKVLFPRKPPESVQQQWYEQRLANCSAGMDKHIASQEAARKSSA